MKRKIEFRALKDLKQVICSFSTGPYKPGALSTTFPSTLLFSDRSKLSHNVYWLDCSGNEPKLDGKYINIILNYVDDICYIPDEKKPLLVATDKLLSSVQAYNAVNNNLEWSTQVRGYSITTDGQQLLVCNRDDGIRMLSLSGGESLGHLIRKGDRGLGMPYWVCWSDKISSLIVAHEVNREYHISTIEGEKVYSDLNKSESEKSGADLDKSQSGKSVSSICSIS